MNSNDSQEAPSPTGDNLTRKARLAPPTWVWVVLVIAGLVIAVLRGADVFRDHAVSNVATLIVAFVAMTTALIWFSFFSGHSRRVRMIPLVAALLLVAVAAAALEIDRVSAELIPTFVFRFSRKPDELLKTPKPEIQSNRDVHKQKQVSPVDLRTTTEYDFPQFLGPQRSLSIQNVTLAQDWKNDPPQLLWRQEIGAGWSGFAVVGGYAVTMEQRGESEMITCYNVGTGQLHWAYSTATRFQTILAGVGPRATPTIDEGMVYTLGAKGRLACLDGANGRCQWTKDLWAEFGVTEDDEETQIPYGRAASPLVVGDLVVVPAGGPVGGPWVSLAAYDKRTGDRVWRGGNRQISYSSPVLATLGGFEQILIVSQDYVGGHDAKTGEMLWEHGWPGNSATDANVSQAVPLPPDRVFLSKGYGQGAALLQLAPGEDGGFEAKRFWSNSRVMRTKFANVAIRDGYVYGLSDGILECIELKTGKRQWKGGRYGHGQILLVGDLLLVCAESGELSLVEATPERGNSVLGSFQAVEGMTWNNLALSGPYLLVRNAGEAACYKLP